MIFLKLLTGTSSSVSVVFWFRKDRRAECATCFEGFETRYCERDSVSARVFSYTVFTRGIVREGSFICQKKEVGEEQSV